MTFYSNAPNYPLIPANNLLLGNGNPTPGVATISGAGGTTVTFPGGNILITSSTVDLPLIVETTGPVTMATNTRYVANSATLISFALPATSAVGDVLSVTGLVAGGGGWTVTQGAGQHMQIGQGVTTTGTGGSASSTLSGDSMEIYCYIANTAWVMINGSQGNIAGV